MSALPYVSIVTPSYNQAEFLEQTILSVINQSYPQLEYIIVDGASTDNSLEIIQKYAADIHWWVSEPDKGQAEAINKGLAQAKGEIIAWLNSDDYYLPDTISAAVAAMQENPKCGLVYGDVVSVDEDDIPIYIQQFGNWGLDGLMCFKIIGQPSVFLKREVLVKAGLLDDRFQCLLDHQLWLRIARLATIKYIPRLWSAARFHPGAKNIAMARDFGSEAYAIVEWMKTNPEFEDDFQRLQRKIGGGAHRLNAYYLSVGGLPRASLSAYYKSLRTYPPAALKDWKRVLFTIASWMGMGWLKDYFLRQRRKRLSRQLQLKEANVYDIQRGSDGSCKE